MIVAMTLGLFVLALIAGLLGLGVGFAADPFLSLFFADPARQVPPYSLMLNAVAAVFAGLGFARSGYVDWVRALTLALLATFATPVGIYLAAWLPPLYAWPFFVAAVAFLAYRLFQPGQPRDGEENFRLALFLIVPIAVLGSLLGVGPGFLLLPVLVLAGFDARRAAGMAALVIAPPSIVALVPHAPLQFAVAGTLPLVVAAALGAYIGARITSLYVSHERLKRFFATVIVLVTVYWVVWLSYV